MNKVLFVAVLFVLVVDAKKCIVNKEKTVSYDGNCIKLGNDIKACKTEEYLDFSDCDEKSVGDSCRVSVTTVENKDGKCVKLSGNLHMCQFEDELHFTDQC